MLNIVIGYDQREAIAYHVLSHSIISRASRPVCIIPLMLPTLRQQGLYWRQPDPNQTTDFTYSRFLTPFIAGGGSSIFMDCDMLCLTDIYEVLDHISYNHDVSVVKHNYTPNPAPKFLGQTQTNYPCKNWSSFMVFNPYRSAVKTLDAEYVNTASAMELHQFKWCRADYNIGSLPLEWNHLVGEYAPNPNAKLVHFTRGGPWFAEYADCEYAAEWQAELKAATFSGKVG